MESCYKIISKIPKVSFIFKNEKIHVVFKNSTNLFHTKNSPSYLIIY